MSKQQRKPYNGVLNEPMVLDEDACRLANLPEFGYRLQALLEHYNIPTLDNGGSLRLALELAADHVPGFRYVPKRNIGRPTSLSLVDCMIIGAEAQKLKDANPSLSWRKIAVEISKLDTFKKRQPPVSSETIRNAMKEIKGLWKALKSGKMTRLQRDFLKHGIPIINKNTQSEN